MKIQLDEKALERLIGGDSDIEVELRSDVVQAFAKRHLKGVIEEKYLDEVKKEISAYKWGNSFVLNTEIKQKINDEVKKAIKEEIKNIVKDGYQEIYTELKADMQSKFNELEIWIKENLNEEKGERIIEKVIRSKLEG